MKNIIAFIGISSLLLSCGKPNKVPDNKNDEKNNTSEVSIPSKELNIQNLNAFEENLIAFNGCKKNKPGRGNCKEYLAKAICEYYGIDDLKDSDNYIDYDKIPEKLKELDSWENLGNFNEGNIEIALKHLKSFNKPVLVFNEDDSYVHLVALKPNGKSVKSGKWGNIFVPECISYFPRRKDSFTKKGINYAFTSPENLTIWFKK